MPPRHFDPPCRLRTPNWELLVWFVYGLAQVHTQGFLTSNPIMFPNGNWQYSFLREMLTSVIFKTPLECWVRMWRLFFLRWWKHCMYVWIGTGPLSSPLHVLFHLMLNNLGVEFCHHSFKHETTAPCSKDLGSKQQSHNLKSDLFKNKPKASIQRTHFSPALGHLFFPWGGCQGNEGGSHFLTFPFLCLQNSGHCSACDCLVSTCSVNNVFEPLKGKDPVIFIFFVSLLLPSFTLEI